MSPYSHSSRTVILTMWPVHPQHQHHLGRRPRNANPNPLPQSHEGELGVAAAARVSTSPQVIRTRLQGGEVLLGRGLRSAWAGSTWVFYSSEGPRLHLRHSQVSKPPAAVMCSPRGEARI